MTAIPWPFAYAISWTVEARTWPTLPAGPSSSSDVAVWTESTIRATGAGAGGRLDDLPDVVLGEDADSGRGRTVEEAEPARPEPDLGRRLLAGRVEDLHVRVRRRGRGPPRPGAGASTCRSPARRPAGSAIRARAHRRGPGPAPRCRRSGAGHPGRRSRRAAWAAAVPAGQPGGPLRAARDGSRMTVSTRLFQAPQARHWPSQRRTASPHDWQTYRLWARATVG